MVDVVLAEEREWKVVVACVDRRPCDRKWVGAGVARVGEGPNNRGMRTGMGKSEREKKETRWGEVDGTMIDDE